MVSVLCNILKVKFQLNRSKARVDAIADKAARLSNQLYGEIRKVGDLRRELYEMERELDACSHQWAEISERVKDGAKGE